MASIVVSLIGVIVSKLFVLNNFSEIGAKLFSHSILEKLLSTKSLETITPINENTIEAIVREVNVLVSIAMIFYPKSILYQTLYVSSF